MSSSLIVARGMLTEGDIVPEHLPHLLRWGRFWGIPQHQISTSKRTFFDQLEDSLSFTRCLQATFVYGRSSAWHLSAQWGCSICSQFGLLTTTDPFQFLSFCEFAEGKDDLVVIIAVRNADFNFLGHCFCVGQEVYYTSSILGFDWNGPEEVEFEENQHGEGCFKLPFLACPGCLGEPRAGSADVVLPLRLPFAVVEDLLECQPAGHTPALVRSTEPARSGGVRQEKRNLSSLKLNG